MSKFDVFVNGIQPDYLSETKRITEELSEKLRINNQIAEKIIKSSNSRISQSISKSQAEKLQLALYKMGVICVCKPSVEATRLSLESVKKKEEDGDDTLSACPNCNQAFSGNLPPEKCNNCGVFIEKYLRIIKDEKEKDQIRQELKQKNSIRTAHEKKLIDEKAERERKNILEQEILNENPSGKENDKIDKKTYILIGCFILMVTASCFSYFYFGQKSDLPSDIVDIASEETFQEIDELETAIPVSSAEMVASQSNQDIPENESFQQPFQETDELATTIPASSSSMPELASDQHFQDVDSAQEALQKTHEQASQVLKAFGLDTDAFSKNTNATNTTPNSNSLKPSSFSVAKLNEQKTESSQPLINNVSLNHNDVISPFLLKFGIDQYDWEHFLSKKAEQLIRKNELTKANQVIQHLTETENFISFSGKILNKSDHLELLAEINSNIEEKINASPFELKAQYFSQVAALHYHKNSGLLFNRAENSWKRISDPNKKLASAVKIAVSFFKAGNTVSANRYFNKIKPLLSDITSAENQISSRIAISQAFKDVDQNQIALNWLKSTNKFISSSNKSSLQKIINSYAYLNQISTVQALINQAPKNITNELIYSAMVVLLDSGLNENATTLAESIEDPVSKAIAFTRLAGYFEDNSSYLAVAESILNKTISGTANKTIVSSRIAQHYARQNNSLKVNELFSLTKKLLDTIPSSTKKDKVLEGVLTNYSYPLIQQSVVTLSSFFQSDTIRSRVNERIERLSKISTLF